MRTSNHQRRRRLTSPAALALCVAVLAAMAAAGIYVNIRLGLRGFAAVPIALIVPAAAGFGIVGVIIGRGSARPPGGPLRPAPPQLPAVTRVTVTAVVPALDNALTSCATPGTVPTSDTGEV